MARPSSSSLFRRIAEALERLAPPPPQANDLSAADAFVWNGERLALEPVPAVNRVALDLLQGIDQVRGILLDNTRRFAAGLPANNALLWGSRGMGKSSLVKAVHAAVNDERPASLALIEIHREDVRTLPQLLGSLRGDTVITAGGIVGRVAKVGDQDEILVEIADNVRVRVIRSTISSVMGKTEPVAAESAKKPAGSEKDAKDRA